ncbi:MAG: hypothetical protein HC894_27815 [Microcoleus sp. SM1_3_4]|nr:hypothetical protein [Microcoleus sp. SM1_3_4]
MLSVFNFEKVYSIFINNMIIAYNRVDSVACKPEYIATNHWQEWVNSGVKPSIIAANIYTEFDARKLDEALNRNNKRKWKHSDKLVPAWVVRGVEPETGEIQLLGVQAKPDNPDIKNGSIQNILELAIMGRTHFFKS